MERAMQVLRQHGTHPASHAPERRVQAKLVGFNAANPKPIIFRRNTIRSENNFPYTFMGLEPGTTKDDVRRCLENWNKGDNGILIHSRPTGCKAGAGWQINPGILHAPGSLVTYEPQVASDVFAMFQSLVEGRIVDWSLMTKDVLSEYHHDLDYLIGMLDWDANVNPEFGKTNKVSPRPVQPVEAAGDRVIASNGSPTERILFRKGTDRASRPQRYHPRQRGLRR